MQTARHKKRPPARNLVARSAEELRVQIHSGALPAGTALPSVRQLARDRGISPFSAAAIYDNLVATGTIEAHAGLGYFVTGRRPARVVPARGPEFPVDSIWERRREALARPIAVDAGAGWLPSDWLHEEGVRAALRAVAKQPRLRLEGYGNPLGLGELRTQLVSVLGARGIIAGEDQIVLTQGASQALDLIVRECLAPRRGRHRRRPGVSPQHSSCCDRGV